MKKQNLLRFYEILFCLMILGIFFIPLILLIILKLIADGRPLFYNSNRIGRNRSPFLVYKFRSMINDRNAIEDYLSSIKSYGFEKIPLNARIYTTTGRIFEKFQIVEILQIFNVLQGNMSLIGYRPLPVTRVLELEEELGTEKIKLRHAIKPGITGISQIVGKSSLTNSERVNLENSYNELVQTESEKKIMFYNTLIIIETVLQVFFKRSFLINVIDQKVRNCELGNDEKRYYHFFYYKRSLPIINDKSRIAS